jgi:hypothetical protein
MGVAAATPPGSADVSPEGAPVKKFSLRGRVRLNSGHVEWEGSSGDLLTVPEARHLPNAIEDSAVLLTVAKCR